MRKSALLAAGNVMGGGRWGGRRTLHMRDVCMYVTVFASISSTALEIEALSFTVNRFRKKTKER